MSAIEAESSSVDDAVVDTCEAVSAAALAAVFACPLDVPARSLRWCEVSPRDLATCVMDCWMPLMVLPKDRMASLSSSLLALAAWAVTLLWQNTALALSTAK